MKVQMLTIKEAAALVDGVPPFRIRQMCIDGVLPHIKAGNKYLINKKQLFEVLGENLG
jgi:excisionase family DNA binding protein